MCSIGGFFHPKCIFTQKDKYYKHILQKMNLCMKHRGPDESNVYLNDHFGLCHNRLSIIDLISGSQPMLYHISGYDFGIVYNGELYNMDELRRDLTAKGWHFKTSSDTEVILIGYLAYGPDFVCQMNGIFAFAIMDSKKNAIYLFRDHCGVKPLYYSFQNEILVFASELKALFAYPDIKPQLDRKGLNEIFSIGPAKTSGCGVFKNINELLPAHYLEYTSSGSHLHCYWKLISKPHEDSPQKTIQKTTFLVQDAVKRQMLSDVPICTFLSGGIDSSLVSSICASALHEKGMELTTFSFDFVDNERNFKPNKFQPSRDQPFVEKMVDYLHSNHHTLTCNSTQQLQLLYDSVKSRDLPTMADIDSSMLYFCSLVSKTHKVALTGECADEIFGGYPWFHNDECFKAHTFPWTMDLSPRKIMLNNDFIDFLNMEDYVQEAYENSIAQTPRLATDTPSEARRREITYLNLRWFMQTLLDRMDRTSMFSGLEARVPFADYRIVEYLWNVPWSMKYKNGVVKSLLRECSCNLLPNEILFRKKSPYPKTYDPIYENFLRNNVKELLHDSHAPILQFIDYEKISHFLNNKSDYGKPWFGQLMAGPQMLAYFLQINYWLEEYDIELCI